MVGEKRNLFVAFYLIVLSIIDSTDGRDIDLRQPTVRDLVTPRGARLSWLWIWQLKLSHGV
jgi:hypothetical protein